MGIGWPQSQCQYWEEIYEQITSAYSLYSIFGHYILHSVWNPFSTTTIIPSLCAIPHSPLPIPYLVIYINTMPESHEDSVYLIKLAC